jgi:AraC-like DNA-binding protein
LPSTIRTDEVHEFTYAVMGAEIEFVRKDLGFGPAVMTRAEAPGIQLSAGGIDFSTVMESRVPEGSVAVQLLTHDPGGATMCGLATDPDRPSLFAPRAPVFGHLPAGVRATTIVASVEALHAATADLGLGELNLKRTRMRMDPTPQVVQLVEGLRDLSSDPGLLEASNNGRRLVEQLAVSLAEGGQPTNGRCRRRDSAEVVALAIEYAQQTGVWQPTLGELSRASLASESSLRTAFVEVLGVPPSTYFQLRVLRELRRLLLVADPDVDTVTALASGLGLSQFGRVAGRYRLLFGETPSRTLHRPRQ